MDAAALYWNDVDVQTPYSRDTGRPVTMRQMQQEAAQVQRDAARLQTSNISETASEQAAFDARMAVIRTRLSVGDTYGAARMMQEIVNTYNKALVSEARAQFPNVAALL